MSHLLASYLAFVKVVPSRSFISPNTGVLGTISLPVIRQDFEHTLLNLVPVRLMCCNCIFIAYSSAEVECLRSSTDSRSDKWYIS